MPAPKRRRWFSLSLRTLLIGMTVISVLFGWFLHHRRRKIAERDRLLENYPPACLEFTDSLLVWELPPPRWEASEGSGLNNVQKVDDWAWLRLISSPCLHSVDVWRVDSPSPPQELAAFARTAPTIILRSGEYGEEAWLEQFLSPRTRRLWVTVPFSDLRAAPNLVEICAVFPDEHSLDSILRHPRLQRAELSFSPSQPTRVPTSPPSNLRSLIVSNSWSGNLSAYAWVQRCVHLQEFEASDPDLHLLAAIGVHLGGVESLRLSGGSLAHVEELPAWVRLRHLDLDWIDWDEWLLAAIGRLPVELQSLEIDAGPDEVDPNQEVSADSLATLHRFPRLRRLRLDCCNLGPEHMTVLAELRQLEELSLAGNPLNDAALAPLHRLPQLKMINLADTNAGDEPFANIRGDWYVPDKDWTERYNRPFVGSPLPVVGGR